MRELIELLNFELEFKFLRILRVFKNLHTPIEL